MAAQAVRQVSSQPGVGKLRHTRARAGGRRTVRAGRRLGSGAGTTIPALPVGIDRTRTRQNTHSGDIPSPARAGNRRGTCRLAGHRAIRRNRDSGIATGDVGQAGCLVRGCDQRRHLDRLAAIHSADTGNGVVHRIHQFILCLPNQQRMGYGSSRWRVDSNEPELLAPRPELLLEVLPVHAACDAACSAS